ncbi:hypothetical protein AB4Z48_25405 [Cupriavidus sp. 2TAF22]|uniref:hypothetical protein n=1 Tax=unclassified Cupriavidus TaxID=2640874 RepID=UPI003F8E0C77
MNTSAIHAASMQQQHNSVRHLLVNLIPFAVSWWAISFAMAVVLNAALKYAV